jgi:Plasmid maintenance system antidote protein
VYVPQNRLEQIMRKRGLTQKDLQERTGIPQSDISKIINDRKDIYLKTAQKIAVALGLRVDDIWPYY